MAYNFWDERWLNGDEKTKHPKYIQAAKLMEPEDFEGSVIDVGCGKADFFDVIEGQMKSPSLMTGVDISASAVNVSKGKGYTNIFQKGSWEIEGKYDLAVSIDVLEHVLEPEKFLSDILKVTNVVILVIPNFSSYKQRMEVLMGYVPFQNRPGRGGHVYWFNYQNTRQLVRSLDLCIVKEYHLYSKGGGSGVFSTIFRRIQDLFPNLFAHSFGYRLEKK